MPGKKTILSLLLLIGMFSANNLWATEEYADKTGQECSVCHLSPSGGGELTAAGEGYSLSLGQDVTDAARSKPSALAHVFHLLIGFLHILFGVFWFGTILYVHLILKPGYASRGLPRSEVKLGLVSIIVMGITGVILVAYRVPDPSILITTQFGVLLLIKMALYLIMVCTALFAVFVLGPRLRRKQASVAATGNEELSLAEIENYDGKEGRAAYIGYKGIIYDVSKSLKWKNGIHMGRHLAGRDLTEILTQAPHGEGQVLAMPEIGRLRDEKSAGLTPPQRLFYGMAYLNLGFVFMIILILACWKWL